MDLSPAHIHLMFNHIPVLGPWFLALLFAFGLVRKSPDLLRAAMLLTVLLAGTTGLVFLTGEPAEHQVEEQAWFDEDRVHEHEERAEAGLIATAITGVLALVGLVLARKGRPLHRGLVLMVLAATLITGGLFGWTALAGGEIRHDEVRPPGHSVRV